MSRFQGPLAFSGIATQPEMFGPCSVTTAVEELAGGGVEGRGAIFTRPEVVEFILDLVGYSAGARLHEKRLLEPSFGGGDFLLAAIARLLVAYRPHATGNPVHDLRRAICAVELHHGTFESTAALVEEALRREGLSATDARELRQAWLHKGDFLLTSLDGGFDFVVGNPPYIRQEMIPQALIDEYRRRYATIYDRADIYVPFIEASLSHLREGGVLGFICADRWMKNRYGGPLRRLVAENFHLRAYVDMVDTPAFLSEVIAYPGIFVIAREVGTVTRVAHRPAVEAEALSRLADGITSGILGPAERATLGVQEARDFAKGTEPWILTVASTDALVRRLEGAFPTLEEAGCKVGIGVATGADGAFIGRLDELDVEDDRKLPLVMTRDILTGDIKWRGFGVINPFNDGGGLASLEAYPRLRAYLEARKDEIAGRHVARKAPANWYRTIDRIYPALVAKPKLLIPDIKGEANIVFDEGRFYPHHNLYFITSDVWDLRALQAVLMSGIARLFVAAYSTKMRGGYLRFQAQYLRRIRLPRWDTVPPAIRATLVAAASHHDRRECDDAVARLYGLTEEERAALAPDEIVQ